MDDKRACQRKKRLVITILVARTPDSYWHKIVMDVGRATSAHDIDPKSYIAVYVDFAGPCAPRTRTQRLLTSCALFM